LNPNDATFKNKKFTFAGTNGKGVQRTVGTVLQTQQLDYVYDTFAQRPAGSKPFPKPGGGPLVAALAVHANTAPASGPVSLGGQPVSVALATPAAPAGRATFSAQIASALDTSQVYVVLNNIQVRQEPGVVYAVYLDVPQGSKPAPDDPGYVGTLNFFGVHGEHAGHDGVRVAFLATDVLKTLQQQGRSTPQPTVTLVPQGDILPGAEPKIGSISLVSQR
jgi:hypothetical protein